jgi:hypothetical protein
MHRFRFLFVALILAFLAQTAWAQPAYFVQTDIVRGAEGAMGEACVPNAVFHPTEKVVWRAYVYDGATGERLDAATVEERGIAVTVTFDGEPLEMAYHPHPPGADDVEFYWTHAWVIPEDQPMGVYTWSVTVQDASGAEATYEPIGQGIGLPNLVVTPAG